MWQKWQKCHLEAVGAPLASHTLLAHTCHHLRNVDGGPFAAALAHVQRAIVPVQCVHAHLHQTSADQLTLRTVGARFQE